MAVLTREQILARKRGHETVALDPDDPDAGEVVVRGLSRDETHEMMQLESVRDRDAFMVATGLVEPAMTTDDVAAWFAEDATGPIDRVAKKITELSGMAAGQGKDATKSVPRRRGRGRA